MNRMTIITIMVCLAVLMLGVIIYLSNNISSQNSRVAINVKITSFNITGYSNPVGIVWNDQFVLTYFNNETIDVCNTTITFSTNSSFQMRREIGVFDSVPPHNYVGGFMMNEPYPLGNIRANETKEFHGCIWNNLLDSAKVHGASFTATLQSNDTILDQATIYLQGSQNPSDITCTYHKLSSVTVNDDTSVVFLVTATYNRGNQTVLSYDNFYVGPIHTTNDTYSSPVFANEVKPFEIGSITLDPQNANSTFKLTFQFPTNYKGYPVSSCPLGYHLNSYNRNFIEIIHENLLDKD